MFNFSGSEIVFLLLLALIVLGPEKLPEAVRKFGKTYAEFKKVTTGFQTELKSALDEPMREMKETADALRKAAQFDVDLDPRSAFAQDQPATTPKEAGSADAMAALTQPSVTPKPVTDPPSAAGPAFGSAAPPRDVADNEPPLVPTEDAAPPHHATSPDVEDGAEPA